MIETTHVRCCNEPLRNARATVLNWTTPVGEFRIGERLSRKVLQIDHKGVSMKRNSDSAITRGAVLMLLMVLLVYYDIVSPVHVPVP